MVWAKLVHLRSWGALQHLFTTICAGSDASVRHFSSVAIVQTSHSLRMLEPPLKFKSALSHDILAASVFLLFLVSYRFRDVTQ